MQRPVALFTIRDMPTHPSISDSRGITSLRRYAIPLSIDDGSAVIVLERAYTGHLLFRKGGAPGGRHRTYPLSSLFTVRTTPEIRSRFSLPTGLDSGRIRSRLEIHQNTGNEPHSRGRRPSTAETLFQDLAKPPASQSSTGVVSDD
ncbi:hypothetical protein NN3_20450 [Nocardia neocaledoniensis NBRC 108232]|nr:hypothetical protein NN3_20450 [Nocardia neocaledoniensis NBRC 108232]